MRPSRASLRSRCRTAAEPAPDCSPRSNASLTRQDSLPVVVHEATVLGSMPSTDAAPLFPFFRTRSCSSAMSPQVVDVLHAPALFDYRLHISHASAFAVQLAPSDRGPLHSTHALPRYATCNLPATALACAPWREPRNQIARFDLAGVPIPSISTMLTTRMQLAHSRLSLYTGMTPQPAHHLSGLVREVSASMMRLQPEGETRNPLSSAVGAGR